MLANFVEECAEYASQYIYTLTEINKFMNPDGSAKTSEEFDPELRKLYPELTNEDSFETEILKTIQTCKKNIDETKYTATFPLIKLFEDFSKEVLN